MNEETNETEETNVVSLADSQEESFDESCPGCGSAHPGGELPDNAHRMDTEKLRALQTEMYAWQLENFGEQPSHYALRGVLEELGELSHAVLKSAQGIRNDQDHESERRDAHADALVYFLNYCSGNGIDIAEVYDHHAKATRRDKVEEGIGDFEDSFLLEARIVSAVGHLYNIQVYFTSSNEVPLAEAGKEDLENALKDHAFVFLLHMEQYALSTGINLIENLESVWRGVVAKRNWKEDPTGGGGHGTQAAPEIEEGGIYEAKSKIEGEWGYRGLATPPVSDDEKSQNLWYLAKTDDDGEILETRGPFYPHELQPVADAEASPVGADEEESE